MTTKELREKSVDELKAELLALTEEQFKMRMQRSTGQLSKPHSLRTVRRSIARVKTLLTESQRQA